MMLRYGYVMETRMLDVRQVARVTFKWLGSWARAWANRAWR
jgi:hypothetical protein